MPSGKSDGTIVINTVINTDGMNQGREDLLQAMKGLSSTINRLTSTIKQAFSNLKADDTINEINRVGKAAKEAEKQVKSIGESAKNAADEATGLSEPVEKAGKAAKRAAKQIDFFGESARNAADKAEGLSEPAEKAGKAAKEAEKQYKNLEFTIQRGSKIVPFLDDTVIREEPIENPELYGYNQDAVKFVDNYWKDNAWKQALDEAKSKIKELSNHGQWYGDDDFDEAIIQYESLNAQVRNYKKNLSSVANDINNAEKHTNAWKQALDEAKSTIKELAEQGQWYGDDDFDEAITQYESLNAQIRNYRKNLGSVESDAIKGPEMDTSTIEGQVKSLKNKLKELRAAGKGFGNQEYDQTYRAWQKATDALNKYKNSLDSTNKNQGVFKSMLLRARDGILKVTDAFKSYHKNVDKAGSSNKVFAKGLLSAMNAAKTMLLFRAINAVIDSVKEGIGDLVQYSEASNDAMSQLMSSLDYLKHSFVAAFAPVLTVVCPILSTLIDYLAEAANGVAALISALTGKNTYIRAKKQQIDYAKSLKDTSSAATEASDSLDETKESVEALDSTGIDEFNILGDKDKDSDKKDKNAGKTGEDKKGASDVFDTKPISGEIASLADAIKGYFADIFKPIKDAWDTYGDAVIQAWKTALADIIALGLDIAETFRAVWTDGTGYEFISAILRLITTVGQAVDALAVSFRAAWDDNNNGYNYLKSIFTMFTAIINLINAIGQSWVAVWSNGTGKEFFSNILQIFTNIHMTIANLADRFREAWEEAGIGTSIIQGLMDIVNDFLGHINRITEALREWSKEIDFSPLLAGIDGLVQAFRPLADKVGAGLEWCFKNLLLPLATWAVEQAIPAALDVIAAGFQALDDVLNALKPVGSWLWENFLKPLASWTGGAILSAMEKITELFTKFGNWVSEYQQEFVDMAVVVGAFFAAFKIAAIVKDVAAFIGYLGGISGIVSSLGGLIGSVLNPIALGVAAVVAALLDLWHTSESFRDTVIQTFTKVKDHLVDAFAKVKEAVSPLWDAFKSLASSLYDFYENSPLKSIVALLATLATTIIGSALSTLIDTLSTSFAGFAKILTGAIEIISGVFDILTALFTLDFDTALKGFNQIGEGIQSAFSGALDLIVGIGGDLVLGLYNGIKDAISSVGNWLKEHLVDPVVKWVKKLFGVQSPSKVFAEIGGFLIKGLLQGIQGAWKSITEFFSDTLEKLKTGFSDAWKNIQTATSDTWKGIKTTCSDTWNTIKSETSTGWENLKAGFSSGCSNLKSTFADGWEKLKANTSSGWENLKKSFSSGCSKVESSVSTGWKNLKSSFSGGWEALKSGAGKGWDNIKTSFSTGWNNLKSNTQSGWSVLKSSFTSGVGQLKNAFSTGDWSSIGNQIMTGIYNGINAGWNWLTSTVSNLASNLLQTAKYALGIQSPSRKFREEFGKNIPLGAAEGVSRNQSTAVDAVADMAEAMQEAAGDPIELDTDASVGKQALLSVRSFFHDLADEIQKGMDNITDKIGTLNASVSRMQYLEFPQIYRGGIVPPKAGKHSESNGNNEKQIDYAALKRAMKEAFAETAASKSNGKCYLTLNIDGREWFSKWLELYQMEKDSTGVDPILGL